MIAIVAWLLVRRAGPSGGVRFLKVLAVALLGAGVGALVGHGVGGGIWWIGGSLLGTTVGGIVGGGRKAIGGVLGTLLILGVIAGWFWLAHIIGGGLGGLMQGIAAGFLMGMAVGWSLSEGNAVVTGWTAVGGAIGGAGA